MTTLRINLIVLYFLAATCKLLAQFDYLPGETLYDVKQRMEPYLDSLHAAIGDSAFYHEGATYDEYMKWMKYWEPRLFPHGRLDYYSDLHYQSIQQISNAYSYYRSPATAPNQYSWHCLGPFRKPELGSNTTQASGVGPVEFIQIYKNNPDRMLCGNLKGGLFYSDNAGQNWNNAGSDFLWDFAGCGWAEFHPNDPDIWYAANTQEYCTDVLGIYRTFNHGQSWDKIFGYHVTGTPGGVYWERIIKTVLDHTLPDDILYVATTNGIYKSTDLLNPTPSFAKLTDPLIDNCVIFDLEMKINDHNYLIATVRKYDAVLGTYYWQILETFNGGTLWNVMANTPAIINTISATEGELFGSGSVGITVETTNANPDYFYFVFDNSTSNCGLYRYESNNVNWTNLNPGIFFVWYGNAHGFGISQIVPDEIFVSHLTAFKKRIGGLWLGASGSHHADIEDFVGHPTNPDEYWMADHGGIRKSVDKGLTWVDMSEGLAISQVLGFATSATNPEYILLGLDHDGSIRSEPPYTSNWLPQWRMVNYCCDGLASQIDPTDPKYMWTSTQFKSYISSDFGLENTFTSFDFTLNQYDWSIVVAPNQFTPSTVYSTDFVGTRADVARSLDRGITFPIAEISNFSLFGMNNYIVEKVFPSKTDGNYLFAEVNEKYYFNGVEHQNHRLFRTTQANAVNPVNTWEEIPLPVNSWIDDVETDLENPDIIYIGWGSGAVNYPNASKAVYKIDCSNGIPLRVETDLTKNLPFIFSCHLELEKATDGGIYLASDAGVFYTNNKLLNDPNPNIGWVLLGTGLPHVSITGIEINYVANKIRVGTKGRGVWEGGLYCPVDIDLTEAIAYPSDEFKEAQNSINSNALINPSLKVRYRAGEEIRLTDGFHAVAGSDFKTFIHGCNQPGNSFRQSTSSSAVVTEEERESEITNERFPFDIYPNPTPHFLTVKFSEGNNLQGKTIVLKNIMGKQLKYFDAISGNSQTIPVEELNNGVYIIELVMEGISYSKKFVKM